MSLLIKDGVIVTMSSKREIIWDGAIYIEGDKIKEVGKSVDLETRYRGSADRVIDATKKVVFPGFINIHTHGVLSVLRGQAEDEPVTKVIQEKYYPIIEILRAEDCYHIAKLAFVELLKFGSTTVADSYYSSMLDVAQAASEVGIRAYLGEVISDADHSKLKQGVYEYIPSTGEKALSKALELIEKWHMRDGGRIRGMLAPEGGHVCSPELLKKVRDAAHKYGVGIDIHVGFSPLEVAQVKELHGKSLVEYLESVGILGPDLRVAHAVLIESSDVERLARSRTNVAHCASINANRAYIAPVADMLQAGINVGLGVDCMAADMIEVMRIGLKVSRIKTGIAYEPTPYKMLEMATINGAKALGVEKELGSIEPGKIADLVIVDYNKPNYVPLLEANIITNLVHTGLSSDIDTVLVGGKVLVEGGKYIEADEQEIMKQAQKTAEVVWQRWSQRTV